MPIHYHVSERLQTISVNCENEDELHDVSDLCTQHQWNYSVNFRLKRVIIRNEHTETGRADIHKISNKLDSIKSNHSNGSPQNSRNPTSAVPQPPNPKADDQNDPGDDTPRPE